MRILQHPHAIPVSYKAVRALVPVMLESRENVTDVILHIGVAMGRKTFDLECRANRRGYADAEDMYGETMPDDRCSKDFHDCEETLSTMLDADEILRLWLDDLRTSSGAARQVALGRSDSAGGYICEYMFYDSLAWSARRNLAQRSVARSERSVLFLHVPAWVAQDVEMGRKVTIALLRAIAHSWSTTKRYATLVGA